MAKFRTMFNNDILKPGLTFQKTRHTFKVLPPYAKDESTGEILNDSPRSKRIISGTVDIQEDINSFRDSCSLSSMLAQLARSGGQLPNVVVDDSLLAINVLVNN